MSMIKEQNFGVEIELTGITRCEAAEVVAEYYGTSSRFIGTYYKTYGANDRKGRTWKAMSDGSIQTRKKVDGMIVSANSEYSCEVVTPILQYDDKENFAGLSDKDAERYKEMFYYPHDIISINGNLVVIPYEEER